MSAHTPGPWEWVVSPNGSIRLQTPDRGHLHVMTFIRKGMQGAQPRFRSSPRGIMLNFADAGGANHPDARLISAAPDMYEALKATLRELTACANQLAHHGYRSPEGGSVHSAQQEARAALAKAGGQ